MPFDPANSRHRYLIGLGMAAWWRRAVVPVWDFSAEYWRPYVRDAVADFNAKLPEIVPRMEYVAMGEMVCERLPTSGRKGGISVCSRVDVPNHFARVDAVGDRLNSALVVFRDIPGFYDQTTATPRVVCHELAHALYGAEDAPAEEWPHPNESCVQGNLNELGPWDVEVATRIFGGD